MVGKRGTTWLVLILSMVFWSFSYIWIKVVYEYLNPIATVFLRLILASVFLISLSAILGKLRLPKREHWPAFFLLAFFEPFMYYLGESFGVSMVSSTVAAIIISTIPLFVPLSMHILAREPVSPGNFAGILISFAGVLMVVLKPDLSLAARPLGLLCLGIAVLSVMGYSYLLQKLSKEYNAFTIISVQNFLGIFYFLPLVLIFDLNSLMSFRPEPRLILNLAALAIFASALAFFLFTLGTQRIGVSKATMFTYLIPILTALLSFFLMEEEFTAMKWAGIAVVIGGLVLSRILGRRYAKPGQGASSIRN